MHIRSFPLRTHKHSRESLERELCCFIEDSESAMSDEHSKFHKNKELAVKETVYARYSYSMEMVTLKRLKSRPIQCD